MSIILFSLKNVNVKRGTLAHLICPGELSLRAGFETRALVEAGKSGARKALI